LLRVRQDTIEGIRVFRLEGALSALEAPTLKKDVRAVLGKAGTVVVLDLAEVEFVDSAGLGALVALHKSACEAGGELRVYRPRPNVLAVLELARIHRFLNVVHDGLRLEATEKT
jgi:anti-sigma B factor antagonist